MTSWRRCSGSSAGAPAKRAGRTSARVAREASRCGAQRSAAAKRVNHSAHSSSRTWAETAVPAAIASARGGSALRQPAASRQLLMRLAAPAQSCRRETHRVTNAVASAAYTTAGGQTSSREGVGAGTSSAACVTSRARTATTWLPIPRHAPVALWGRERRGELRGRTACRMRGRLGAPALALLDPPRRA